MCLLLPFLISKKNKSDRAKAASATAHAPRPVADGYASQRSGQGQHEMGQHEMGQPRPMGYLRDKDEHLGMGTGNILVVRFC
jgi:hypothetical protein